MRAQTSPYRNFPFILGASLLAAFVIFAVLGPLIAPYTAEQFTPFKLAKPSWAHWFGTDRYGRDVLSRVIIGTRVTVVMATLSTILGVFGGIALGMLAGYKGGWLDEAIMRGCDVVMSFPSLLLALLVVSVLGPNEVNAVISIGVVFMPRVARVVRSAVLPVRSAPYIEAAELRAERTDYILFRELFPNVLPVIIVESCIRFSFAAMLTVSLSFLGLGAQPPSSDWGLMISAERGFMLLAPWVVAAPAAFLSLFIISINLLGDSLRVILAVREI
ncbi:ABC transporter permease [Bosea sp. (in: a-proteobacteria)]|uniref:ABC transporter permease n=1 Tax=Bosea sp. (in: a-proteobacteria) TaxID=1871050 RepID=UPI0026143009|nr:ABC transporter permease [Bosea sp. (in: a-proteobacteria)]MCO5091856.1 ABC transporter permease [Bosea sp. (in: a-proteobacteria)]